MSVSGSELQTAVLKTVANGGTSTEELDATEDRVIEGYTLQAEGIDQGDDLEVYVRAFIGVDPGIPDPATASDAEDLGGKFLASLQYRSLEDITSGTGVFAGPAQVDVPTESQQSWDWNEDAVLTLRVQEGIGTNSGGATLTVYYREV